MNRFSLNATAVGLSMLCATGIALAQRSVDVGEHEFASNCVYCHGVEGRGDGPYSPFMTLKSVPDLTLLARNNGGVYPYERVYRKIDGRREPALGVMSEMPIWGAHYAGEDVYDPEGHADLHIAALMDHVERLQAK